MSIQKKLGMYADAWILWPAGVPSFQIKETGVLSPDFSIKLEHPGEP
jgi:hypothetical protein